MFFIKSLLVGMGISSHHNRSKVKVETSKKTAKRTAEYEMTLEEERAKAKVRHTPKGKAKGKIKKGIILTVLGFTLLAPIGFVLVPLGIILMVLGFKKLEDIKKQEFQETIANAEARRIEEEEAIREEIKFSKVSEEFGNKVLDGTIATKQQAIVFLRKAGMSQKAIDKTVSEYGF